MNGKFTQYLQQSPIVAILRGITPEEVPEIAETLISSGVFIIEVPLNSPDRPFESIRVLREVVGERGICGAGTVLNIKDIDSLVEVGGEFVVSPNTDIEVIKAAVDRGLPMLPGCLTPTEVFAAIKAGAENVKIFPGGDLGIVYFRSIMAVIPPHINPFIVGGADAENMAVYWQAGARGFGFGSNIYRAGDTAEDVQKKAKVLVEAANLLK